LARHLDGGLGLRPQTKVGRCVLQGSPTLHTNVSNGDRVDFTARALPASAGLQRPRAGS
jgi:hypothetical protein